MTHNELGKLGEDLAVDYLTRNGFTITDRNWRTDHLEIDIIASKDSCIHFIEVKTRGFTSLMALDQYLSIAKFNNFKRAVESYVDLNSCNHFQLDLIVINYCINSHTLLFKQDLYIP